MTDDVEPDELDPEEHESKRGQDAPLRDAGAEVWPADKVAALLRETRERLRRTR